MTRSRSSSALSRYAADASIAIGLASFSIDSSSPISKVLSSKSATPPERMIEKNAIPHSGLLSDKIATRDPRCIDCSINQDERTIERCRISA